MSRVWASFSDPDRNSKSISCVSEELSFSNTIETKLRIGLSLIEGNVLCEHCHLENGRIFASFIGMDIGMDAILHAAVRC